jgi:hypothetical protein
MQADHAVVGMHLAEGRVGRQNNAGLCIVDNQRMVR